MSNRRKNQRKASNSSRVTIPIFEEEEGKDLEVDIPACIRELDDFSINRSKGKAPVGESSQSAEDIKLSAFLSSIRPQWIEGRPHIQHQKLIRDMILSCYNIALNGPATGRFTMEDVTIVDGETNITIHNSKRSLRSSLETLSKEILKSPPEQSEELNDLLTSISMCNYSKHFAALYYQPILQSKRETVYFLLDIVLLADFSSDLRYCVNTKYEEVKTHVSMIEGFDELFSGELGEDYRGALNCAKTLFHHFNDHFNKNLSLEEIIDNFFVAFPHVHLEFYRKLEKVKFDFSKFFEAEKWGAPTSTSTSGNTGLIYVQLQNHFEYFLCSS